MNAASIGDGGELMPRRRWGRWVLAALTVFGLMAGAREGLTWATSAELFPLQAVRLEGRLRHVSETELRQVIATHLDRGMLGLDMDAIRRSVEALPWVDRAAVRRLWPGTLELWVEEEKALGRWGERALMNLRGEVFRPVPDSFPGGLPRLAGPQGSAETVAERYRDLRKRFAEVGFNVTGVHLDARRSWSVQLDGRIEVQLGSEEVEARVERFNGTYPLITGPDGADLRSVDLRYPNGFAVAWTPAAEEQN